MDDRAVRGDELCADEVVAGQAVLRREMSDTAAEREAADAGRADHASGRHEPERLRRQVEVEPRRSSGRARDSRVGVDLDRTHRRQVDHEPVIADAVPRRVVSTSAHGHLQLVGAREIEGSGDIAGAAHCTIAAGRRSISALKHRRAAS